jgi:hypothetical protein
MKMKVFNNNNNNKQSHHVFFSAADGHRTCESETILGRAHRQINSSETEMGNGI